MDTATQTTESTFKEKQESTIISWSAPARPFKKRSRQFFLTTLAVVSIISLIVLIAEGIVPVLLIVSIVFLFFVLNTVEPETIEYKITNSGIKVAGSLIPWSDLTKFWTARKMDSDVLVVESIFFPGRVEMVLDASLKEGIVSQIEKFLPQEKASPTGIERFVEWFESKLPRY